MLIHWGRNKIATKLWTALSNVYVLTKCFEFWFEFNCYALWFRRVSCNHMQYQRYMISTCPGHLITLHWRHDERDGVLKHRRLDCLLNRFFFGQKSKKTSKLCVTGLCGGIHRAPVNSPHKRPVTPKMFPFNDVIMICGKILVVSVLNILHWYYPYFISGHHIVSATSCSFIFADIGFWSYISSSVLYYETIRCSEVYMKNCWISGDRYISISSWMLENLHKKALNTMRHKYTNICSTWII